MKRLWKVDSSQLVRQFPFVAAYHASPTVVSHIPLLNCIALQFSAFRSRQEAFYVSTAQRGADVIKLPTIATINAGSPARTPPIDPTTRKLEKKRKMHPRIKCPLPGYAVYHALN